MKIKLSLAAVVVVSLVGCGGGGSSDSPSVGVTPPPVVTPPVVTPPASDLQKTVPSLTYAADSQEFAFVSAYNDFRSKLGLGLLAQSPVLDTASANHLKYVLANDVNSGGTVNMSVINATYNRPQFHVEDASKAFFTGIQESDRAKYAGYAAGYAGEQIAFGGGKGASVAFNALVSTVYHRAALMFQFPREIGVAVGTDRSQTLVMEFGYQAAAKGQYNASDFLGAYPADKQIGVPLYAGVETPNPFPELSTANADFPTKTSYPINVTIQEGLNLTVGSFTVTEAGQSVPLDVRLMTKANDPNAYLAANTAFIIGKVPFKANTTYNVVFTGTAGNTAVTKSWSFTTGG